jgi:competence protein ComEA
MNPFLQNPIATPMLAICKPVRPMSAGCAPTAAAATRHFFVRSIGRLAFAAGLALASSPLYALDVNTATAAELETIRGLGPRTAETIIKERDRGGKFESFNDLSERVRGIGQKKAQALQAAGLSVGDSAPRTEPNGLEARPARRLAPAAARAMP